MAEQTSARGNRKQRKGVVVKDKMDKTVVVQVERVLRHPLYGKVIRMHKKYKVHDENNQASIGDKVVITECRPISKTKRWRLLDILKHENAPVEISDDSDAVQA